MSPRDTRTGGVLEQMVLPALRMGGYQYSQQIDVGKRLGGNKHKVDLVIMDSQSRKCLVSLKWQQTSGTAEQKVPFEAMCLQKAIKDSSGRYDKAYLVLGGDGWKLKDFYVSGGLTEYMRDISTVKIISLDKFVAMANKKEL